MFSNAGFQITSNQSVPDALVDTLLISGNEAIISGRLHEHLEADLNEQLVTLVPVSVVDSWILISASSAIM
jgi:hypothetical protein